ncbi:MAG TPA: hypothetical protein VGP17_03805 [Solirubrobacteraceae bacterium]|nr:hypothetical protein [Solirubrobacteraceae bacterium]
MDLDRLSIEKRDFPVARRGYEPAAVDAHLRAVALAVAELSSQVRRGESVGAAAATQVQGILDAAQDAAAQIVSDAEQRAARATQEAQMAAQQTRSEAIAAAQAHIAAVAQSAAALRSRVESMDADLHGLAETLRGGAGKLAQGLAAVEADMAALYDAASGRRAATDEAVSEPVSPPLPAEAETVVATPTAPVPSAAPPEPVEAIAAATFQSSSPDPVIEAVPALAGARSTDPDGARLIALNMALNGDSREATDRYLEQHFDLLDREKLVDEVFAAIEG